MLHVSHPYLVSLSFYTIPIYLFFKFAGLLIYLDKLSIPVFCKIICKTHNDRNVTHAEKMTTQNWDCTDTRQYCIRRPTINASSGLHAHKQGLLYTNFRFRTHVRVLVHKQALYSTLYICVGHGSDKTSVSASAVIKQVCCKLELMWTICMRIQIDGWALLTEKPPTFWALTQDSCINR